MNDIKAVLDSIERTEIDLNALLLACEQLRVGIKNDDEIAIADAQKTLDDHTAHGDLIVTAPLRYQSK